MIDTKLMCLQKDSCDCRDAMVFKVLNSCKALVLIGNQHIELAIQLYVAGSHSKLACNSDLHQVCKLHAKASGV